MSARVEPSAVARPVVRVPAGHHVVGYVVLADEALADQPAVPIAILAGGWKHAADQVTLRELVEGETGLFTRIALPFRCVDPPQADVAAVRQPQRVAVDHTGGRDDGAVDVERYQALAAKARRMSAEEIAEMVNIDLPAGRPAPAEDDGEDDDKPTAADLWDAAEALQAHLAQLAEYLSGAIDAVAAGIDRLIDRRDRRFDTIHAHQAAAAHGASMPEAGAGRQEPGSGEQEDTGDEHGR